MWFGITIVRLLLSYHDNVITIMIVNIFETIYRPALLLKNCFLTWAFSLFLANDFWVVMLETHRDH